MALNFVLLGFDSVSIQESEFCVAVKGMAVMDTYIAEKKGNISNVLNIVQKLLIKNLHMKKKKKQQKQ